jgi:serine/threonine-protein kinase
VLEKELGRGGMAIVYLARDIRHKRLVALKVLHPELGAVLGTERFLREVETAAGLQHPHILPVFDSGEAAGRLWYTMPYVEGESLRDRLKREVQLPVEDAIRLTREVAEALDYAHRHGVVHRDIKPDNILLTEGHASVADFGIAKALEAGGADQLTQTGMTVGTPQYMSPEQAAGGLVDARSDIYSLGCVLYEMLAGEPPYLGHSAQAIAAKRLLEPVPRLRTLRDNVPETLEQAVTRALARTPADRFPTAAEFARALTAPPSGTVSSGATAPHAASPSQARRLPRRVATLLLALLLGVAVLFVWHRSRADGTRAGAPIRLAVLPFENLGDSADAYFADGVADEVRGKLAAVPGVEVIARASSAQYRRTTKPVREVARELGVRYLLTGTVRWDKQQGTGRVRVSPELVEASSGTTLWQAPFDAAATDVFRVQADVAARVAEALGVALGVRELGRLAERPTANLAAYDAYLRGEEAGLGVNTIDQNALQRARDYYERAVAFDSSFALAWAQLSRTYSQAYFNAPSPEGERGARHAAERALALAPDRPEGYLALGDYHALVRKDYERALEEYARGRQLAPREPRLLSSAGFSALALARGDEALAYLRRAVALDPRSVDVAWRLSWALLNLRRYPEALAETNRALTLAPASLDLIETKVMIHLGRDDLAEARAVLRAAPPEIDPAALSVYVANYASLGWVLDEAQQQLLIRLSPAQFNNDRATWGGTLAEVHLVRGDTALARAYADSSLPALEARVREVPEDAQAHVLLGFSLALAGRYAEAIREGERAVTLTPTSRDALTGAYAQHQLARIYLLAGDTERALDRLEPLLKVPYWISPGWLRIDPNFAPLRGNPRFERLVAGK